MRPIVRGAAALLAAPALALSALVATSAPASAVADPAPAERAADWLETQLTDGLVHNDQHGFDDVALSGDVAFALERLGGHDDAVAQIMAAIEPLARDQWYTSTFGGVTTTYAGSLAKAAALVQRTGGDPTDFGGHDLVAELADTVSTTGPTAGRVQDVNNDFGDTNTFGQAYAAEVFDVAGSELTGPVTDFLLAQQCEEGWFRLYFADRDEADQTCDRDDASQADPDATAIAVLSLLSQTDDTDVAAALESARAWLLDQQRASGAFIGGPTTAVPNANSTGLVGTALAALGETAAAGKAAGWLRAHQLVNVAGCRTFASADTGAVAYDDRGRAALARKPISATVRDQVRRATVQALGVLPLAQTGGGDIDVLAGPDYVRAGGRVRIGFTGAAPGEAICARIPGGPSGTGWANPLGEGGVTVKVPAGGAISRHTYRVGNQAGPLDTVRVAALGRKKLDVTAAKKRIPAGGRQTVVVRGLAPGELASVDISWVAGPGGASGMSFVGQANRRGVLRAPVKVAGRPGEVTAKAQGQFKNRKGSVRFTVTR
ncbi:prenyltransferase/squalene oxidase repeat-containing protein [Nocardioides pyridinolyticus]